MNNMLYLCDGRLKVIVPDGEQLDGFAVEHQSPGVKHVIKDSLPSIPAAIEFSCGDCFFKAFIYEEGVGIVVDLIKRIVYPDKPDVPIVVEVYSKGKLVEKQSMSFIEVSLDSFCSGEFEVVRFDPKGPDNAAKSDIGLLLKCGDVCKKVLNIKSIFPDDKKHGKKPVKPKDVVVSVFPPFSELLLIKAFAGGRLFEKQGASQLFTLESKICGREKNAIQINHIHREKDC